MVWSKVVEYAENSRPNTWMYINENDMSEFVMPRLSRPALTCWKGGILAIGGPGIGACDNEGFSRFYYSMDGGIYWRKTTDISLPTGFSATTCTMATDSKNNIWMVCGGSGQVWYGRLSGEESSDQKTFTEWGRLKIEDWKLKIEDWKLKIEDWRLKIEDWRLKICLRRPVCCCITATLLWQK